MAHAVRLLYNVSMFNQPDPTDEQFFKVNSSFGLMLCFTPIWSHKHFRKWVKGVPKCTEELFQKYHQELNKVKIEGREVKHIKLRKLPENSLCQCKASKDVSELDYT